MLKKVLVRLKNPKVITAVVSGILIILVNLNIIGADMSLKVQHGLDIVLTLGVTIGIFGNPDSHIKKVDAE